MGDVLLGARDATNIQILYEDLSHMFECNLYAAHNNSTFLEQLCRFKSNSLLVNWKEAV